MDHGVVGPPPALHFDSWTSGATASTIDLDWGTAGAVGTAQADGLTQFSSTYSTTFVNQNGVAFFVLPVGRHLNFTNLFKKLLPIEPDI